MSGTAAIAAAKNRQSRQSALSNNNAHCNQQQSCSRQGNQNQMQYQQQNMTQEPVPQQQRININPMEILKDHELRIQKIESIDCEKIFSGKTAVIDELVKMCETLKQENSRINETLIEFKNIQLEITNLRESQIELNKQLLTLINKQVVVAVESPVVASASASALAPAPVPAPVPATTSETASATAPTPTPAPLDVIKPIVIEDKKVKLTISDIEPENEKTTKL